MCSCTYIPMHVCIYTHACLPYLTHFFLRSRSIHAPCSFFLVYLRECPASSRTDPPLCVSDVCWLLVHGCQAVLIHSSLPVDIRPRSLCYSKQSCLEHHSLNACGKCLGKYLPGYWSGGTPRGGTAAQRGWHLSADSCHLMALQRGYPTHTPARHVSEQCPVPNTMQRMPWARSPSGVPGNSLSSESKGVQLA